MLKIKRVYDPTARGDGERILVDQIWPRGLSKRAAAADKWMKKLGPSHALRTWFGHDPGRWEGNVARARTRRLTASRTSRGAVPT